MGWLIKIGLVTLALYIVGAALLYALQRRMMFSPDPTRVSPLALDLPAREVELQSQGGHRLYSWHLAAKDRQPTILFFHGNGGNVANREIKFRLLNAAGFGVFMLGYRGFGGSEGQPSEVALVKDARLAYDHLLKQGLEPAQIVIYGESIGSSIAVQLAAQVPSAAVILEAPMYSVLSIAEGRYPYVPVRTFLKDKFQTNLYIREINSPLLVIHGTRDEVIPMASGRRLFDLAREPKIFHAIEGGGHNNLYEFPIVDLMVDFLSHEAGNPGE